MHAACTLPADLKCGTTSDLDAVIAERFTCEGLACEHSEVAKLSGACGLCFGAKGEDGLACFDPGLLPRPPGPPRPSTDAPLRPACLALRRTRACTRRSPPRRACAYEFVRAAGMAQDHTPTNATLLALPAG